MQHLEGARDEVLIDPEGKKKMMDKEENSITANHEAGHALVSYYLFQLRMDYGEN